MDNGGQVSREIIERMEAERRKIELAGIRESSGWSFGLRRAVLDAYRSGAPIAGIIAQQVSRLQPTMLTAMETAHLQGRLRATLTARASRKGKTQQLTGVYKEAVDFVKRRMDLTDDEILRVRRLYGNAVTSFSGELTGSLEGHVAKAIEQATRENLHTRGGMRLISEAFDKAGVTPTHSYQIENIYRTQTSIAYNAGRWNSNQAPEIQEILWGFEYVTVGDDRVRPTHAALDGVRLPKDDPKWKEIWPPNGWGCRCSTLEIYDGDREARVIEVPTVTRDEYGNMIPVQPDDGWALNVGQVLPDRLAS